MRDGTTGRPAPAIPPLVLLFDEVAEAAERLLGDADVTARWDQDSALEGYTVGGLAGHLVRAVLTVQRYLDADPPPETTAVTDAAGYLVAALAAHDPVDSDLHRSVRQRGVEAAADGPAALTARFAEGRAALTEQLTDEVLARPVQVFDGIALRVGDYLETRLVELVVHLDDLATSVGRPGGVELPTAAYDVTAAVLAQVAVRRVGGLETVRSLARRERHPEAVRAL